MGFVDSIKDVYFNAEEKWYGFLDALDQKIPIGGIVEKVDNIAPSFAVFLGIIVLTLLILGFMFIPGLIDVPGPTISVKLLDQANAGISQVDVEFQRDFGGDKETETRATNDEGEISNLPAKIGEKITVYVSLSGYSPNPFAKEVEITANEDNMILIQLDEITATSEDITFNVTDLTGLGIDTEKRIEFTCSNYDAVPPRTLMGVTESEITVSVPNNCGELRAEVNANGFELDSRIITDGSVIELEKASFSDVGKGSIVVYLKDSLGNSIDKEIDVYLYISDTDSVESIEVSENGIAYFEDVPAGDYYVQSQSTLTYNSEESSPITVTDGSSDSLTLNLKETILGEIKIKSVKQLAANAPVGTLPIPINGAKVTLKLAGVPVEEQETDAGGAVEFGLTKLTGTYTVTITKAGYCPLFKAVSSSATQHVFQLEPNVGSNCPEVLTVKVVNQEAKPIINAKVDLYDKDKYKVGFDYNVTDLNGETLFNGVSPGTYQVFAHKGSLSGWSDVQTYFSGSTDTYVVTIVIPNTTVTINASDKDGRMLQFATVSLMNNVLNKEEHGPAVIESPSGTINLEVEADREVYAIVEYDGLTNYTTLPKKVLPENPVIFTSVLESELISGKIEAEFLGLFKGEEEVINVSPGEEYEARFLLRVPVTKNYDLIGLHVRTGSTNKMETDEFFIKSISAGPRHATQKGMSYNDNSISTDSGFITAGESKWATFEMRKDDFKTGIIEASATIKVKETADEGSEIPLRWRAFGLAHDTGNFYNIDRSPEDNLKVNSIAVPGFATGSNVIGPVNNVDELYANTGIRTFEVGVETICDEKWCFSNSVKDIDEGLELAAAETMDATIGKSYDLEFTIINNAKSTIDTYSGADIRIINSEELLLINSYKLRKPDNGLINEPEWNKYATGWRQIGNIGLNSKIKGEEIKFTAEKSGTSPITIEVRSNGRIRFTKDIMVSVLGSKEFGIEYRVNEGKFGKELEIIPAGNQNTLFVRVKDSSGVEFANVDVKAKSRFGDTVSQAVTNTLGIAELILPGLKPRDSLNLEVSKKEYATIEKELVVDDKLVSFDKTSLDVTLNATTKPEDELSLVINNLTDMKLKIKGISLAQDTKGLINKEAANDFLSQYEGRELEPNSSMAVNSKFILSDFGRAIEETTQGKTTLNIQIEGSTWNYNVPVNITAGLGGELDVQECFTVSDGEWKDSTLGTEVQKSIVIENNCTVNGQPVDLWYVSGKMLWAGSHVGTFTANIENVSTELGAGFTKTIKQRLSPASSLDGVLNFSPYASVKGKAKGTIVIQAEHKTDSGTEILEQKIETEIDIVNLEECISVDKDLLIVEADQTSGQVTIETKDCGGNVEFELESPLTLSSEKFTLPATGKKTVDVLREENIPGQYPLYVSNKSAQQSQFQLKHFVRVRLKGENECFKLSRFEYDVFTDDLSDPQQGIDIGEVTNVCHERMITATLNYNDRNLWDAMKKGLIYAGIGAAVGGIYQVANDCDVEKAEKGYTYVKDIWGCKKVTDKEARGMQENKDLRKIYNDKMTRAEFVTEAGKKGISPEDAGNYYDERKLDDIYMDNRSDKDAFLNAAGEAGIDDTKAQTYWNDKQKGKKEEIIKEQEGEFTLTIEVVDAEGKAVDGAEVKISYKELFGRDMTKVTKDGGTAVFKLEKKDNYLVDIVNSDCENRKIVVERLSSEIELTKQYTMDCGDNMKEIFLTATVLNAGDIEIGDGEAIIEIIKRDGMRLNSEGVSGEEISTVVEVEKEYVITAEYTDDEGMTTVGEINQKFASDVENYPVEIKLGSIANSPEEEGEDGLTIKVSRVNANGNIEILNEKGIKVALWRKGRTGIFRAKTETNESGEAKFEKLKKGTYYAKAKYKPTDEEECFGDEKIILSGIAPQSPIITIPCTTAKGEAVKFTGVVKYTDSEKSTAGMILKIIQIDDKEGLYRASAPVLIGEKMETETFSLNLEKEEIGGKTTYKTYAVEVWNPDGTQETYVKRTIVGFDKEQNERFDRDDGQFEGVKDLKAISMTIIVREKEKDE